MMTSPADEKYFRAKVGNVSRIHFIENIVDKLNEKEGRLGKFKRTCFGHLLDMKVTIPSQLCHYLLLRRVDSMDTSKMIFEIGGKTCEFTATSFCIITGLRMQVHTKRKLFYGSRLLDQYFGGKIPLKSTFDDVFRALGPEVDEDDVVKMALIYMLEIILLGTDLKVNMDSDYLLMVDDLDYFNNIAWGNIIYKKTIACLHKAVKLYQEKVKKCPNALIRYSLYGFPLALVVWAYEVIPELSLRYTNKTKVESPRILKYESLKTPNYEQVKNVIQNTKSLSIITNLGATEIERCMCWYNGLPHDPTMIMVLSSVKTEEDHEVSQKDETKVDPVHPVDTVLKDDNFNIQTFIEEAMVKMEARLLLEIGNRFNRREERLDEMDNQFNKLEEIVHKGLNFTESNPNIDPNQVMPEKKVIAICQSGGEFEIGKDGVLSYHGGDTHAIDIDDHMNFDEFKVEVAEMFDCSVNTMSIKYLLPGNKKTLVTVSNDKDLKRMIQFHGGSVTTDIYVIMEEVMTKKKVIAICQSGGEFETGKDGVLSYHGGDAHAIDIDDQMNFDEFKVEVAEMFNCSVDTMSIKYFLPGNKKTLITVSNDKDLKRMIKFHGGSVTADIYVIMEEVVAPDVSNMLASRSSRTTLSETVVPGDAPLAVINDIGLGYDNTQPDIPLDATLDVVDDTNPITAHIGIPGDITPILPLLGSNDEKNGRGAQQWQNTITGVGQRFSSVHEFRESLRKYAIAHQFAFRYKKNDSHRVTVKCKAEGCPWRIHASRLSTTQLICIKKMNSTHTCEGAVTTTGHQATRSWVASIIKEKLKVFPNYKPKDIVIDIKEEYGIQLNYFQAWRGKEIAKEQLQGSYKEAYNQLPLLCEKIMETNPGSAAAFETKEDSSFHRLFISFHASLCGFQQGCRPLIFLDSIPLKSKYQGTLLAATAADGDDGVFPVAFSVVDTESDDNWSWFLLKLKLTLSTTCPITFVADRQKGLTVSIAGIFKGSFHGYCLRYLTEQLIRDLKGQFSHEVKRLIVEDFYAAAYATKPDNFQRCIDSIKSISLEAYNWILQSEPQNWANAFFQGSRYNHMTSNFGELFYSWVSDAHELPITQMVDAIRVKIMELIYTRRADSDQWLTRLTPSMEEKLEKEGHKVHSLQVLLSAVNTYEVCGDSVEAVDVDHWDCSCKGWQLTGLPCSHAISVLSCTNRSPYDFCSRYLTTETYRLTYSESVHPIPHVDMPIHKGSLQASVIVTPPPTRRPPGRPTTKQYGSPEVMKRQLQCSRCKGLGHNKSTCKEFLPSV